MAVNKVVFGGETVIDLTGDDVTAEKLVTGVKAHDKSGNPITGTNPYEKTATDAAVTAIGTAIAGKGVVVPSGTKLDGMAALIDGIEAGGEDVSAETAEYTSLLTDLETAIDALPDAGSGGGTSIETCTITVDCYYFGGSTSTGTNFAYSATVLNSSGDVDAVGEASISKGCPFTIENVVKGSVIFLQIGGLIGSVSSEKCELISKSSGRAMIKVTGTGEGSLIISDDD